MANEFAESKYESRMYNYSLSAAVTAGLGTADMIYGIFANDNTACASGIIGSIGGFLTLSTAMLMWNNMRSKRLGALEAELAMSFLKSRALNY